MKTIEVQVMNKKEAERAGHAAFNECDHSILDLSNQQEMHTVSIKLPNGEYVTICNIKFNSEGYGCLDIKHHEDGVSTKMLAFENGSTKSIAGNMYSFDYKSKEKVKEA